MGDSEALVELAVRIGFFVGLLLLGLVTGSLLEQRHFSSIRRREEALRSIRAISLKRSPSGQAIRESQLVMGGVVVSLDYFKRISASLKAMFGGRLRAFEPLLERGRREALLRMKEQCRANGFDEVINVRIETSRLANADGNTTAGVEILAYGTAVSRRRQPSG